MTTTPRTVRSVRVAARVTTLLARDFPEAGPGDEAGFRVLSDDQQEPRRMFVRWYGAEPLQPGWTHGVQPDSVQSYRARIKEALVRNGYAVTLPPGMWEVYVDDRPVDPSGPRYDIVPARVPFGDPWLVLDRWTRVHAATAATEEDAKAEAMRLERAHALTDARLITAPGLWPHLERADELLGDGVAWLRQEKRKLSQYTDVVRHDRLDALVQTANALAAGHEVTQSERLVTWEEFDPLHPRVTFDVRWVPQSSTPTVGWFPFPESEWKRVPVEDAAISALIAGGLTPVVYGEPIDDGLMCERGGFMVTAREPLGLGLSGVHITPIGEVGTAEFERVPGVLEAGGWRVETDEPWAAWVAFPPGE